MSVRDTLPDPIPPVRHLAIVMDGNRRWAKARHLPVYEGHRAGSEKLREVCDLCAERGIPWLSVYAFSTENWKRSDKEVETLMNLIVSFFKKYEHEFEKKKIRVSFAGDLTALPARSRESCERLMRLRPEKPSIHLVVCLNYGGQDEIIRAFRRAMAAGVSADALSAQELGSFLDLPEMPSPDLVIRPGGEKRLSNFLLWQSAYSELYFSDVLWPDFSASDLDTALRDYRRRDRRYGGNSEGELK